MLTIVLRDSSSSEGAEQLVQAEDGAVALREGRAAHAPDVPGKVAQAEQHVHRVPAVEEHRLMALVEDQTVEATHAGQEQPGNKLVVIRADVLEARDQDPRRAAAPSAAARRSSRPTAPSPAG